MKKPVVLIIMDGYGLRDEKDGNAISMAKTPNLDLLMQEYPTHHLNASGLAVGLPDGQMGNSEVGHLNIGAGRIVYQSLTRINKDIEEGTFFSNEAYVKAAKNAKDNNTKLHIMGLLSDGGVHSHIDHIKAFFKLAKDQGVKDAYFHAFLDGRDTPPDSGISYIKELESYMSEINYGKVASVGGRFYGMDRDNIWERVQTHYDVLVGTTKNTKPSAQEGLQASYDEKVYDEFVIPFNVVPEGIVEDNDSVIFANFRPDRAIQISKALSNPEASGIDASNGPKDLFYVSTMEYSDLVKGEVAYGLNVLDNLYGDVISEAGLSQLRIAETQKYAHVTFFFDGGKDKEIKGSERVLVNSPKIATFDMMPEMAAYEVTDKVLDEIEQNKFDTIVLNFANCDMVGHTGIIPAAIKAVEVVDECVGKVVDAVLDKGGVALVTADHGNAEKMLDANGNPFTAHTTSIVPLIVTDKEVTIRDSGILADIAPTMLEYLGIKKPAEMTGESLVIK
jgi:2,3-bisphosphoglycerate-independent phosphoglycerate mutase